MAHRIHEYKIDFDGECRKICDTRILWDSWYKTGGALKLSDHAPKKHVKHVTDVDLCIVLQGLFAQSAQKSLVIHDNKFTIYPTPNPQKETWKTFQELWAHKNLGCNSE